MEGKQVFCVKLSWGWVGIFFLSLCFRKTPCDKMCHSRHIFPDSFFFKELISVATVSIPTSRGATAGRDLFSQCRPDSIGSRFEKRARSKAKSLAFYFLRFTSKIPHVRSLPIQSHYLSLKRLRKNGVFFDDKWWAG